MTYVDPAIVEAVADLTPCHLDSGEEGKRMRGFGLGWLPALALVDPAKERAVHTWLGYLPPEHYAVELAYGKAMGAYFGRDLAGAIAGWTALVDAHPKSERCPEALYWCGVAAYRNEKGGMEAAQPHWQRMVDEYPDSLWSRKVEIFL